MQCNDVAVTWRCPAVRATGSIMLLGNLCRLRQCCRTCSGFPVIDCRLAGR
jgi:hypothetical protein